MSDKPTIAIIGASAHRHKWAVTLVITNEEGDRMVISPYFTGFDILAEAIRTHVPPERRQDAEKALVKWPKPN